MTSCVCFMFRPRQDVRFGQKDELVEKLLLRLTLNRSAIPWARGKSSALWYGNVGTGIFHRTCQSRPIAICGCLQFRRRLMRSDVVTREAQRHDPVDSCRSCQMPPATCLVVVVDLWWCGQRRGPLRRYAQCRLDSCRSLSRLMRCIAE